MSRRKARKSPAHASARGRARNARKPASRGGSGGRARLALGTAIAVIAALAAAAGVWAMPRGAHGWRPLGGGRGAIRWVETTQGGVVTPPAAPDWVRRLRQLRVPWPSDLPAEPPAASFGSAGDSPVVWFLIRNERPQKELWHVDRSSVAVIDGAGHRLSWTGGSGAALGSAAERTQLLYLRLPPELAGAPETTLRFRLALFPPSRESVRPHPEPARTRLLSFRLD